MAALSPWAQRGASPPPRRPPVGVADGTFSPAAARQDAAREFALRTTGPSRALYARDPGLRSERNGGGLADRQKAGIAVLTGLATQTTFAPPSVRQRAVRVPDRAVAPVKSSAAGMRPSSRWIRLTQQPYPLLAVLLVQTLLSLRIVWSNTASSDEALYLSTGHLEWLHWLRGAPIPNFASYFSGAPVIYPPIGALADSVGGLVAARILSLCFMLVATVLLYDTTRRLLLGRRAAICAACVFALLGPTEALAYATYDAMALMLIALAAWFAVRASGRHPEPFILLSALAMGLANASKYASALWDPAVIAVAIAASWHAGPWRRLLRASRLGFYWVCAVGIALFRFGGAVYVHGVLLTTLARSSASTPPLTVLGDSFDWIAPAMVLSALAVVASVRSSPRVRFLCLSVAIACWLAPANQARIDTLTSLHKHVDFGAWFAAIGAGYVIVKASQLQKERSWHIAVATAVVLPLILISYNVSGDLFRSWPSSTALVRKLQPLVHPGSAHYLMGSYATVLYYYLHADLYPGQIVKDQASVLGGKAGGCAWFDPAKNRELTGTSGCEAAVKAHFFQVIETDDIDGTRATPDQLAIWNAIKVSGAYRLVYRSAAQYHPNDLFQVWELKAGKGRQHK